MNKKQKIMLCRIAATAVLLLALNLLPIAGAVRIILYLAAYLTIGYDILRKAGKAFADRRGRCAAGRDSLGRAGISRRWRRGSAGLAGRGRRRRDTGGGAAGVGDTGGQPP